MKNMQHQNMCDKKSQITKIDLKNLHNKFK
jgi:hypothetical protein